MVITKKEAEEDSKNKEEGEEEEFITVTGQIDKGIRKSIENGRISGEEIKFSLPYQIKSAKVKKKIIDECQKAGWKIEISDMCGIDHVTLS